MASTRFLSEKDDLNVELAFQAIAALPTLQAASDYLKAQHGLTATPETLRSYKETHPERFQKAYVQAAPLREAYLSDGLLENAAAAAVNTAQAMERTKECLDSGRVAEPWRVARDMADVMAKSVDKSRLLQEKPTQIVAKSDTNRTMAYVEARLAELESGSIEDADVVADGLPA